MKRLFLMNDCETFKITINVKVAFNTLGTCDCPIKTEIFVLHRRLKENKCGS